MTNIPPDLDFQGSSQEERNSWYQNYKVQAIGSANNYKDRCKFVKDKYKEWGLEGKSVLDVGCHDGYVTRSFLHHGSIVHGIDIGEHPIEVAIERAKDEFPLGQWRYSCENILEDNTAFLTPFDFVVCCEVIEHIPYDDVTKLMRRLQLWSAPGGYVAISTPQEDGKYGSDQKEHINCYNKPSLLKHIETAFGSPGYCDHDDNFLYAWWCNDG